MRSLSPIGFETGLGKTVLVVEDNAAMRKAVANQLLVLNYRSLAVPSAPAALVMLETEKLTARSATSGHGWRLGRVRPGGEGPHAVAFGQSAVDLGLLAWPMAGAGSRLGPVVTAAEQAL